MVRLTAEKYSHFVPQIMHQNITKVYRPYKKLFVDSKRQMLTWFENYILCLILSFAKINCINLT